MVSSIINSTTRSKVDFNIPNDQLNQMLCEKLGIWKTKRIVLMGKKPIHSNSEHCCNTWFPFPISLPLSLISIFKTEVWTLDIHPLAGLIQEFPDTFFLISKSCFLFHTILQSIINIKHRTHCTTSLFKTLTNPEYLQDHAQTPWQAVRYSFD